jgi:magnesium transporter
MSAGSSFVHPQLCSYNSYNAGADWIAHGILDSVVDSFFPFLEKVEKEVVEVEELVFSGDQERVRATKAQSQVTASTIPSRTDTRETETKKLDTFKSLGALVDEKSQAPSDTMDIVKTRFSLPRPTIPLFFRRVKRALLSISIPLPISLEANRTTGNSTASTLHRMARTRKLVTSLTRLLATKSEVVTQIRKRLLTTGQSGLGNGAGKDDDIEVAIYMGDVHGIFLYLHSYS